ncbi:unnamed protein product [Hermetia illucens]|uniref:Ig-like domain-containing protein n=1 Tax=Hermetia illucens TaxID=343691 RepID=A0A7R8UDU1_HERIL|nr:unnamed protein product [Hermetia illucens]
MEKIDEYTELWVENYLATALKDVRVIVPRTVKRGDNATLSCYYDLQNDTLYSVKWYKGRREFYRYTPRQTPPMKVFPHSGINVERSKSNESHLLLTSVGPSVSGKYSCEVSADAPSFDTDIMSGDLEVVDNQQKCKNLWVQERLRMDYAAHPLRMHTEPQAAEEDGTVKCYLVAEANIKELILNSILC